MNTCSLFLATKLLQSTVFFSLLAESILKKDYANFSFIRRKFLVDAYFTLYMSQSHAVLLEIQLNVTKASIKCSVEKYLEVIDRHDIQPFLVILTDKASSSVRTMLLPISGKPHWQILNSTVWAKNYLIFSKDSISFSEDEASKFDPLMTFIFYFFGWWNRDKKLWNIGNPMIEHIYDFY